MTDNYIEDQSFKAINFTLEGIEKGEYENCTFIDCDFSGADFGETSFMECEFTNCNLSNVKMKGTGLKDVKFSKCKLLGVLFSDCSEFLFSVDFADCQLDLASFYKLKLKSRTFKNCSLVEVDFAEANLAGAMFDNCDLSGATFDRTLLEKADFRSSFNFTIDPELNRIRKAKFSISGLPGLLAKYDIDVV